MHWVRAEFSLFYGEMDRFQQLCAQYFPGFFKLGWHLQGAWENVIGRRPFMVDLWGFAGPEAAKEAMAASGRSPALQPFIERALPAIVEEDFRVVEPMPYCPEFRTLKARALLYWTMQTRRTAFTDWVELRSRFVPMAEKRGCSLGAAWSLPVGAGMIGECTEVWYFEDASTVMPLLTSVEEDREIGELVTAAEALLVKESRQIMRPTWYSPDFLR